MFSFKKNAFASEKSWNTMPVKFAFQRTDPGHEHRLFISELEEIIWIVELNYYINIHWFVFFEQFCTWKERANYDRLEHRMSYFGAKKYCQLNVVPRKSSTSSWYTNEVWNKRVLAGYSLQERCLEWTSKVEEAYFRYGSSWEVSLINIYIVLFRVFALEIYS